MSFKYKTIQTFFDADKVACAFLDDVEVMFPGYSAKFSKKSWDIGDKIVIAIADVQEIIHESPIKQLR